MKTMMQADVYTVELIGSGFLAVMAKPVAGEWIEDEFIAISNTGVCQIVSLLEIHEANELGLRREKELALKNGMEYTSYPIPDRGLPISIHEYLEFTKDIYHQIAGGKNTVIHCRAGIGRTGIVAAGVLLHCGFEPHEALKHISNKRGVQVPDTDEQIEWVVSSYNELTKTT